jgi:hypothetical protein
MKKTTFNKSTLGHLLISAKEQFLLFFNKSLLRSFNLEPASFLFKTSQKLCLVFFFLGFFSANAATIYVNSATGSDANAGTIGAPYKTFHKAYTMAAASADVINLTGTFDWTAVDEIGDAATSGYTISKSLIIQGQAANSTTIQAANADNIADRRIFTISYGYTVVINKNYTNKIQKELFEAKWEDLNLVEKALRSDLERHPQMSWEEAIDLSDMSPL